MVSPVAHTSLVLQAGSQPALFLGSQEPQLLPAGIQFSCSDTLPCTAKHRATYSSVIMFPFQYKQTAVARERDLRRDIAWVSLWQETFMSTEDLLVP